MFGVYEDATDSQEYGLLSKYSSGGSLVWRRTLESNNINPPNLQSLFTPSGLDADPSYYYILYLSEENNFGAGRPDEYTFAKLSNSGNGLGAFQYTTGKGTETVDYVYLSMPDKLAKLSDGSVRNDTTDLLTYPFSANKLLFDDLATQVTNKKRQMDSADSFEYSGSPAIRSADFTELSYTTDTIQVQTTGQEKLYTTVGQYSFVVPSGVTEVSAVCVGGGGGASGANGGPGNTAGFQLAGGGGGGGGLAYGTFAVTPGEVLTVVVGDGGQGTAGGVDANDGEDSTISRGATVLLNGGGGGGGLAPPDTSANAAGSQANTGGVGGTSTGTERDGGGTGGTGGRAAKNWAGGAGGGGAGYSGNGGNGGDGNNNALVTAGSGGGGSGGTTTTSACGGGGGVGVVNGEGASGLVPPVVGTGGNGGSSGGAGFVGNGVSHGGLYGGGGGSDDDDVVFDGGDGAQGAVRIIWGVGRSFPSTLTLPNAGFSFVPVVEDKSNKGRTGEIEGISANASGYWEFTGTDNTFIATQKCNEIFEDGGSGTIEMWVRMNDVTTRQTLCSGYLSSGPTQPDRWDFEVSGGVLRGGSHDNNFFAGTTTLSTATWYHFVFTLDKSSGNGTLKAYVNGVEDTTQVFTVARDWATDVQFCIGNRYLQSSDFPLNADVGEVRCYRRALTQTQIFQNYNATKTKYLNEAPDTAPKIGPGIVYDSNLLLNYDFGNRATYDRAENLISNSNDLSSSYWQIGGGQGLPTRTQDALSPVGDLTAWTVDDTATGADGQGMDANITGLTASSTQTYTMSVYAKQGTAAKFDMYCFFKPTIRGTRLSYTWDTNQIFTNGSDNGGADVVSSGQEYVGNGWYRIWMEVIDSTLGTNTEIEFRLYPASRDTGPTGSTLFWNPQVVKGSTPGRYIKTSGTAITAPTTVKNLSSSSYIGTFNQGAFVNNNGNLDIDGTPSQALLFDYTWSSSFSIEMWIRTRETAQAIIATLKAVAPGQQLSNDLGMTISRQGNLSNEMRFGFRGGASFDPGFTFTNNQWEHYVITYNSSNFGLASSYTAYKNGSSGTIADDGGTVLSGQHSDNALTGHDMEIGEFRIYDKVLTATEVSQNFNATRGKYGV